VPLGGILFAIEAMTSVYWTRTYLFSVIPPVMGSLVFLPLYNLYRIYMGPSVPELAKPSVADLYSSVLWIPSAPRFHRPSSSASPSWVCYSACSPPATSS
jgi:hypothetical protein